MRLKAKMLSIKLSAVSEHEHLAPFPDNTYRGKYTVGRFHLADTFILEYMKVIHGIEIPDSWVSGCFPNIPDIDSRKIMYMECCDILSIDTINEIRNVVKSPPSNLILYRNGADVINIEVIGE